MLRWFSDLLFSLGLWSRSGSVVLLGLDNAGKTTLLHMLKTGQLRQNAPTQYATSEEVTIGKLHLRAFDLGGHAIARRCWADYFARVSAVVFLVDATDADRLPEARAELTKVLMDDRLASTPVLILGNKTDASRCLSEDELRVQLCVNGMTSGKKRQRVDHGQPVELFMCSVVLKTGFTSGFEWLSYQIV